MSSGQPGPTALERRITNLRWTTGIVLAGFVLNAGLVVLLVSSLTSSALVGLVTLGIMAVFVVAFALFAESFLLSATGARALNPNEYPWLEPMVVELAGKAEIGPPTVLVSEQPALNAYTTGTGSRAKVVFMAGLLETLTREEVRAVAAHEIGHVVNKDVSMGVWSWAVSSWVTFVSAVSLAAAAFVFLISRGIFDQDGGDSAWVALLMMLLALLGIAVAYFIRAVIFVWSLIAKLTDLTVSRQREHLADATAVAITKDSEALSSALSKIAENPGVARGSAMAGRFCIISPKFAGGWWEQLTSTHPSPESRIKALRQLSDEDLPEIDANWKGLGDQSWILPAGAVGALAILAILVPVL